MKLLLEKNFVLPEVFCTELTQLYSDRTLSPSPSLSPSLCSLGTSNQNFHQNFRHFEKGLKYFLVHNFM